MAQIVDSSVTRMPRRDVPPDVYFGDADDDEMMIVQTVVIEGANPDGSKIRHHVSWASRERDKVD